MAYDRGAATGPRGERAMGREHGERSAAVVTIYAALRRAGTPPEIARDAAQAAVARAAAAQLAEGLAPSQALRGLAGDAAERLAEDLDRSELSRAARPLLDFILYAVNDEHRYDEMPDLECIEAELAPYDDPTDDQWDEAIRTCAALKKQGQAVPRRAAAQSREALPTLACLHAHLPADRWLTLDDVRRAWELCAADRR